MTISKIIAERIQKVGSNYRCNDNISEFLSEEERAALIDEVAEKMKEVLHSLVIDVENDHNTEDTARRVAKMFINETLAGRYLSRPSTTEFPNIQAYDELYLVGPIEIKSMCAHHFQNISGNCWVGVFPGKNVVGLSKFNRIVNWIARRPQIQEEMTVQIADEIESMTKAEGLAVVIKAEHACCTMRGVMAHQSDMTTSVLRGCIKDEMHLRQEFFSLLKTMKGIQCV